MYYWPHAAAASLLHPTEGIQMRHVISAMLLCAGLICAAPAPGAELRIGSGDSTETVFATQKGKRVTVRLRSGQEITGTVGTVTGKPVQLGAVSGKEFFDAVVPLEAVDAVFVKTKD
jgi:hypothetical protein